MVQFTGALAIAGVLFYYAKRDIMTKRKAELDEYRINRMFVFLFLSVLGVVFDIFFLFILLGNRETPGSENTKS
jgi:hypothetical protein